MDLLIFDLDGTLIDSRLDLATRSMPRAATWAMSRSRTSASTPTWATARPCWCAASLGEQASEAQVQEALEFFLEYYGEHELDYTMLYPGVTRIARPVAGRGKADGGADQ